MQSYSLFSPAYLKSSIGDDGELEIAQFHNIWYVQLIKSSKQVLSSRISAATHILPAQRPSSYLCLQFLAPCCFKRYHRAYPCQAAAAATAAHVSVSTLPLARLLLSLHRRVTDLLYTLSAFLILRQLHRSNYRSRNSCTFNYAPVTSFISLPTPPTQKRYIFYTNLAIIIQ